MLKFTAGKMDEDRNYDIYNEDGSIIAYVSESPYYSDSSLMLSVNDPTEKGKSLQLVRVKTKKIAIEELVQYVEKLKVTLQNEKSTAQSLETAITMLSADTLSYPKAILEKELLSVEKKIAKLKEKLTAILPESEAKQFV